MIYAVVIGLASLFVILWVRNTRRARTAWLADLNLPGCWDLDNTETPESIEFSGSNETGRYVLDAHGTKQRGGWEIKGGDLYMVPDGREGSPNVYELRKFRTGNIGINGPDRTLQIFVKRPTNIIPLRRRR